MEPRSEIPLKRRVAAVFCFIMGFIFSFSGIFLISISIIERTQLGSFYLYNLIAGIITFTSGLFSIIGFLKLIKFKFKFFMTQDKNIVTKVRIVLIFPLSYTIFVLATAIAIGFVNYPEVQNFASFFIAASLLLMLIFILTLQPPYLPFVSTKILNLKKEMLKNEKLWLETHYDFIRFEKDLAWLFFYFAGAIFAVSSSLRNYNQSLLAIVWFEVAYIIAIALFKKYRNWLGMDYKEIEGASLEGSRAFARLSYILFDDNPLLGSRSLKLALKTLRKSLEKDEITNDFIDKAIVITTLYDDNYLKMDCKKSIPSLKEISQSFSNLPDIAPVISKIEEIFNNSGSEITKGFLSSAPLSQNVKELVLSLMGILIAILAIFQGPLLELKFTYLIPAQILIIVIILYLLNDYIPRKLELVIEPKIIENYIDRL